MWTILITLIIGFVLGYFKIIPKKALPLTGYITTGGLIILLISMGAGLSLNQDVLNQLSSLGIKALFLAIFSTGGSILLVWLTERRFFHKKQGDD